MRQHFVKKMFQPKSIIDVKPCYWVYKKNNDECF